jgi:hypothetical protein
MDIQSHTFDRLRKFFSGSLDIVEYAGLLVIAFATTIAMYQEAMVMVESHRVALSDLLLMFLLPRSPGDDRPVFEVRAVAGALSAVYRHGGAGALPDPRSQGNERIAHAGGLLPRSSCLPWPCW